MKAPKLLVVYATRYGQTEKIARRIAEVAGTCGVEPTLVPVAKSGDCSPGEFDLLVVASGVYFGRHERRLELWVRRNLADIRPVEAAFVSVSGSRDESYMQDFFRRSGWVPEITCALAGGEPYTKYGFFTRLLMRSIARRRGRAVDVHQDYEFTDWNAVERFTRDFIGYALAKRKSA